VSISGFFGGHTFRKYTRRENQTKTVFGGVTAGGFKLEESSVVLVRSDPLNSWPRFDSLCQNRDPLESTDLVRARAKKIQKNPC
jgi:hypothetical protein